MAALYGPTLLQRLRRRVDRQQLALHALAREPDLRVIELGPETFAAFGELDHLFLNVNTPEDLRRLRLSGGS